MNRSAYRQALVGLVNAIEENVERRVLLDRRLGERRTETVVVLADIDFDYRRACAVLGYELPSPDLVAFVDDILTDPPTNPPKES